MDEQQTPAPETPSILSRVWGWVKSAANMAAPAWDWLSLRQYSFGEVVMIAIAAAVIARLI